MRWLLLLLTLCLPVSLPAATGHFPAPVTTPKLADFIGTLSIGGQAAQVGDEIAFFDPQGVLCGVFRITDPYGSYGILHVYGDDPLTPNVDEGAVAGDVLSIRVWDASLATEWSATSVRLTAATPQGSFAASPVPPQWQDQAAYALDIAVSGTHFAAPVSTPLVSDFIGTLSINGLPAQPGDELAAFDPYGVLAGRFVVTQAGQYGILHVYGDDPATPNVDEGALPGDTLSFRVWDQSLQLEYPASAVSLSAGTSAGFFIASVLPPRWQDQSAFALNIAAMIQAKLDIDGDGQALAATDGVLIQRYLFGFRGNPLITGALGAAATRTSAAAIESYLQTNRWLLDTDGNGLTDALSDGILIRRFLSGFTSAALTDKALAPDAVRTLPTDVYSYLQALMP